MQEKRELIVFDFRYDQSSETITIKMAEDLTIAEYVRLNLDYIGIIRNDLVGLHRCSYFQPESEEHFLAVTALEPSEARQVRRHPMSNSEL